MCLFLAPFHSKCTLWSEFNSTTRVLYTHIKRYIHILLYICIVRVFQHPLTVSVYFVTDSTSSQKYHTRTIQMNTYKHIYLRKYICKCMLPFDSKCLLRSRLNHLCGLLLQLRSLHLLLGHSKLFQRLGVPLLRIL